MEAVWGRSDGMSTGCPAGGHQGDGEREKVHVCGNGSRSGREGRDSKRRQEMRLEQ